MIDHHQCTTLPILDGICLLVTCIWLQLDAWSQTFQYKNLTFLFTLKWVTGTGYKFGKWTSLPVVCVTRDLFWIVWGYPLSCSLRLVTRRWCFSASLLCWLRRLASWPCSLSDSFCGEEREGLTWFGEKIRVKPVGSSLHLTAHILTQNTTLFLLCAVLGLVQTTQHKRNISAFRTFWLSIISIIYFAFLRVKKCFELGLIRIVIYFCMLLIWWLNN